MFSNPDEQKAVRTIAQTTRRWTLVIGALVAPLLATALLAGTAMATPAQGVTQTPIASGVLPVPIRIKWMESPQQSPGHPAMLFPLGEIGAATDSNHAAMGFGNGLDVSSVAIVKNVVQPGGYFGWHQHGGPSWIVVTQGTLTFYSGDDATCTGHPVSAGDVYFDPGDHTHNARNETNQPAENYVVRMLPEGGAPRVDMPNPGVCGF